MEVQARGTRRLSQTFKVESLRWKNAYQGDTRNLGSISGINYVPVTDKPTSVYAASNIVRFYSAMKRTFLANVESISNIFWPHYTFIPLGHTGRAVVKEGGQGRYYTEFGAGSGRSGSERIFPTFLPPTYIFHIFDIFHIFALWWFFHFHVNFFQFLISYFKLTSYFEVLSKPATSYSNLSLIVEAQGAPGHDTF